MRRVSSKLSDEIEKEWDSVAALRRDQIQHGKDLSYIHVLKPCILRLCLGAKLDSVLDVGCGIGALSLDLASRASRVVGIDISSESLRLAREAAASTDNIVFEKISAESLAGHFASQSFTLAVANMSLSAMTDLRAVVHSISSVLARKSYLVMTIPHPWFWPLYAGFSQAEWFRYSEEIAIEWEFEISLEKTASPTTFVHRPLELYYSILSGADFIVDTISEPMPSADVEALYPARWTGPRFLAIRCMKG